MPAAEKDRSPSVNFRVAGTTNADELEDLRRCRDSNCATCCNCSERYAGARLCLHLNTRTQRFCYNVGVWRCARVRQLSINTSVGVTRCLSLSFSLTPYVMPSELVEITCVKVCVINFFCITRNYKDEAIQRGLDNLTIWFAVLTHFQIVTDRQMDRQTFRPRLRHHLLGLNE